jgi:SAM-dependent methyltransferase
MMKGMVSTIDDRPQVMRSIALILRRTILRLEISLLSPFRQNRQVQIQHNIFQEVQRGLAIPQTDFPARLSLPHKYGCGLPERVIELLLAKLVYQPNTELLDVGHANAMACHLKLIKTLPSPRNITGIDIANPSYDVSDYYQDSVCGDIADTCFDSDRFHCIWCISALEHFGMDNSGYTDKFERAEDLDARALKEMLRILRKGGVLLITVPYGKYEDHGWLRNYDQHRWQILLNIARPYAIIRDIYFRHTYGAGWTIVVPEELRYVGYYNQANAGAGGIAVAHITKL